MFSFLLLMQFAPVTAPAPAPALPCRLQGPKGKLVDVDPKLCEQSTWDRAALTIPELAARRHTTLDIDIDQFGRAAACRVVESSGSAALDARACDITLKKARYVPALGGAGAPVATTKRMKVTWAGG